MPRDSSRTGVGEVGCCYLETCLSALGCFGDGGPAAGNKNNGTQQNIALPKRVIPACVFWQLLVMCADFSLLLAMCWNSTKNFENFWLLKIDVNKKADQPYIGGEGEGGGPRGPGPLVATFPAPPPRGVPGGRGRWRGSPMLFIFACINQKFLKCFTFLIKTKHDDVLRKRGGWGQSRYTVIAGDHCVKQ